ncbi:hypothetical protein DXB27_06740 [Parabacteroides gordonii]|jgi:hypothetical protein|nr:hypothetical protein DXB27_06740 [Parabacteroides gordonii]
MEIQDKDRKDPEDIKMHKNRIISFQKAITNVVNTITIVSSFIFRHKKSLFPCNYGKRPNICYTE